MTLKARSKVNPKQVLASRRTYCDEVHDKLIDQGVRFFTPEDNLDIDSDYLSLPEHITEVSSQDLGEYLNAFTQQKVYLRTLLGYAEMYAEEARQEYFEHSKEIYRDLLGSKYSETSKEREVNTNPDVQPYYDKWQDCKAQVRLLNLNITSIEEIIFMVSREVTRRTGDCREEQRNYNVGRT